MLGKTTQTFHEMTVAPYWKMSQDVPLLRPWTSLSVLMLIFVSSEFPETMSVNLFNFFCLLQFNLIRRFRFTSTAAAQCVIKWKQFKMAPTLSSSSIKEINVNALASQQRTHFVENVRFDTDKFSIHDGAAAADASERRLAEHRSCTETNIFRLHRK